MIDTGTTGGVTVTVNTAIATGTIDTVARIATETGIVTGIEIEIVTATATVIATAAAATVTVVTEMEARGTEMIGGVIGMGETGGMEMGGTEEAIALLSLNHLNVERADGTTKENINTLIDLYVHPTAP